MKDRIINWYWFQFMGSKDFGGWFRVFGFGMRWKDTRKHPLLFSERHGNGRKIGHYHFAFLKPRCFD